jgi:hypothetical protein
LSVAGPIVIGGGWCESKAIVRSLAGRRLAVEV